MKYLAINRNAAETGKLLDTPGKARPRAKPKRNVEDFLKAAITNLIYEFHRKSKDINYRMMMQLLIALHYNWYCVFPYRRTPDP